MHNTIYDSGSVEFRGSQRQLQNSAESEEIRKAKEPSQKTDAPITFENSDSDKASGLIYNIDDENELEDSSANSRVCLTVASQEAPSKIPDDYSIRNVAIMIDVLYEQSVSISSTDIESLLNDQNVAMALSVAGCGDTFELSYGVESTGGKRRRLQDEKGMPFIIYSEVDSWKANGGCVENTIAINSLQPWKDFCQQGFSGNIQLWAKQSTTSEDLVDQVARAFSGTSKPSVQSKAAIYAVAIREIYQESEILPEKDSNQEIDSDQGPVRRKRISVRNILMYTLGAACIFVSIVIFIQLGLYEKRRKAMDFPGHVPFEEKNNNHRDSDTNSVDSAIDLMLVASSKGRGSNSSDESKSSPSYASLDIQIPFDESSLGRIRQVGRSQSSLPVMNTRIKVDGTPDFQRRIRSLDAAASKRNYSHKDELNL